MESPVLREENAAEQAPLIKDESWRIKYGFMTDVDMIYRTFPAPQKPRLSTKSDANNESWLRSLFPTTVDEFLGNPEAVKHLQSFVHDNQEGHPIPKTNYIISGAIGSGKSAFVHLLQEILTAQGASVVMLNAMTLKEKTLVNKTEQLTMLQSPDKPPLFVVLQQFESIAPSVQQHDFLPVVAAANSKRVYFIMMAQPDASRVAEHLKQRSLQFPLEPLAPALVRKKLLWCCSKLRIGFTRDGLEELLTRCNSELPLCLSKLQRIFVKYHFISLENVLKSFVATSDKKNQRNASVLTTPFPLSILELNEPLRRCRLCTLIPPCAHMTLEALLKKAERIRSLYPERLTALVAVCPSFARHGICGNIQSLGRCRYKHPRAMHTIDTSGIVTRCKLHTLPLPCYHCGNLRQMKEQLASLRTAAAKDEAVLKTMRRQTSDVEIEKFLFVRDQSKAMKWGTAKRDFDEKLSQLDAQLRQLKADVAKCERRIKERHDRLKQLQFDYDYGKSKGVGKGNARQAA